MADKAPYITIDFFPGNSRTPRLRPIVGKLEVTDANREAALKLGFFTKDIGAGEHIAVVCHDATVAKSLAASLRRTADELEAAIGKAANPFAR